jgi:hypothetical protein
MWCPLNAGDRNPALDLEPARPAGALLLASRSVRSSEEMTLLPHGATSLLRVGSRQMEPPRFCFINSSLARIGSDYLVLTQREPSILSYRTNTERLLVAVICCCSAALSIQHLRPIDADVTMLV